MSAGFHNAQSSTHPTNGNSDSNGTCTNGATASDHLKSHNSTAISVSGGGLSGDQGFVIPPSATHGVLSQMALLGAAANNLKESLLVQQHQHQNHHHHLLTPFQKPFNGTTTNFVPRVAATTDNKQQVINEIAASLADVKSSSEPLTIATTNSFSDSGQPSPATSTTSITSQVLKMQAAAEAGGQGGGGDALLSAVNYSDGVGNSGAGGSGNGDNGQDGPFNVRVPSNMSNLSIDDSFLNMTGSGTIQSGSGSFENLFDGDSNMGADYNIEGQQDLSLSPHSGFSIPDSGALTIAEQGRPFTLHGFIDKQITYSASSHGKQLFQWKRSLLTNLSGAWCAALRGGKIRSCFVFAATCVIAFKGKGDGN